MSYTIQFAPEVVDQLEAIEDYIAHAGSPLPKGARGNFRLKQQFLLDRPHQPGIDEGPELKEVGSIHRFCRSGRLPLVSGDVKDLAE